MVGTTSQSSWSFLFITGGTLAACLLVYYGLPVDEGGATVTRIALFVVGLGGLGATAWVSVVRQVRAGTDPTIRVQSILGLLCPVIVFFAYTYYALQQNDATQFVGLTTRTDALYYTVVTLGTVGYGDVHAQGTAARVVTMVQIVFDLAVIGTLVSIAASRARERAERREQHRSPKA